MRICLKTIVMALGAIVAPLIGTAAGVAVTTPTGAIDTRRPVVLSTEAGKVDTRPLGMAIILR